MSKDIETTTSSLLSLDQAKILFSKGKAAAKQRDSDKAIKLFSQVIEVFEVYGEWEDFMDASDKLAYIYFQDFNFNLSIQSIGDALKIHEKKCPHLLTWKVKLFIRKAEALRLQGMYQEMIQCLLSAQQIMEREQIGGHLFIYVLLLQTYPNTSIGNYAQVEQLIDRVCQLLKKEKNVSNDLMAELYYNKATLEFAKSKYRLAQQNFQKAYELYSSQNNEKKILSYLSDGAIYGILGDKRKEFEQYDRMKNAYEKPKSKMDKYQLALTYIYLGIHFEHKGEIAQSTQSWHYYENALTLLEELNERLYPDIIRVLLNLANLLHKQKNYPQSIEYYQRALHFCRKILPEKSTLTAKAFKGLSFVYRNMGALDKGLEYAQKALSIYQELLGENVDRTAGSYMMIGHILCYKKAYSEGFRYFQKALSSYKAVYGNTHFRVGIAYREIGKVLYFQGKVKSSLEYCQLALTAFSPNYSVNDFYHTPDIDQCSFSNPEHFAGSLLQKAENLLGYYHALKQSQLEEAVKALTVSFETCRLIADYLYQLQTRLKTEGSKLFFIRGLPYVCQLFIKVSLLLAKRIHNPSIAEQAFAFQELAKALLLRSSMQENEAKMKTSIDSNLLKQEMEARNKIEIYLQKIQQEEAKLALKGAEKDETKLSKWKQDHFNAFQAHQKLIERFEEKYPEYYQLKYNLQTISVIDLQKDLEEDTVVVSYFIGTEKGYIFAVTYDEYEVIPFDLPSNFDQQIQDYLNAIQSQNIADFIPKSHALYFLLIEPISYLVFDPFAGNPKNVVILPSAALNYLPFETLIREIPYTTQSSFHQLDYLLQHCQIQYHYSATLYHQSLQKNKKTSTFSPPMEKPDAIDFLGFAPIYTSDKEATKEALRGLAEDYSRWATRSDTLRDGTLAPLPFSEKEVQNIEELFAQKGLKGQSLLYDTATKDHFKTLASNAKYLHIAAHGLTNDEYPKLSGIIFHPTEESSEIHDSILSMGEMYQLQLQADLVVLSSCESGIGEVLQKAKA